ncbi:TetR/AcrR family transcriptional regulator [Paenibacillus xerothermodurans]|uniref:TetR/AcrR family transcriptional regulator n=1 Tax=Paenibacillus xerothermodurans TaxID=1977292 RepID=A0A2W1NCC9_PAEXE|nr:TetR/AcrR family transcriptional regulator [Paenibacillus xerothermodurans]PZE20711.1 TetR/AcrR family transcriptional regulator [Paenibacillus xerothermodurans]
MTANKIRAAALRLFAQFGYEATPLSEIAKAVGIKTPSLYAHFNSKEQLFLAVFEDLLQEQLTRIRGLEQLLGNMSIEERLYTILQDASQSYLLGEEGITFLKRAMLFPPAALQSELRARFAVSEAALSSILANIFTEGMRNGSIRQQRSEDLLASFYCLLDGAFIQQFYYARADFEQRLQSIWRIYWQGIKASGGTDNRKATGV